MDERNRDMDGVLYVDDRDDRDRSSTSKQQSRDEDRDESRDDESDVFDEEKADDAADVLEALVDHMRLDVDVHIRDDDERIVLDVTGPDAGRAIGKKGQTLDALQFLVNKIVNRHPEGRRHVIVDSGSYRDRHDSGLVSMARREAKRAVQGGKVITLQPMSPRDRRVIHLSLARYPDVSTRSDGVGADRRLQIIPGNRRKSR